MVIVLHSKKSNKFFKNTDLSIVYLNFSYALTDHRTPTRQQLRILKAVIPKKTTLIYWWQLFRTINFAIKNF